MECRLCARGGAKCLILVNSHSKLMRQALLIISFYRTGTMKLREVKKLANVSQQQEEFVLWPKSHIISIEKAHSVIRICTILIPFARLKQQ